MSLELKSSEKVGNLLEEFVKKAEESDWDPYDFMDECVGGIAQHHASMYGGAHDDCDASDYWDLHHEPFEAGVKLGVQFAPLGGTLLCGSLCGDDVEGVSLGGSWAFWFHTAMTEDEFVKGLRAMLQESIQGHRKESGLLPFPE